MKQIFRGAALALALSMIFLLGGCAGGKAPEADPAPTPDSAPAAVKSPYEQGEELVAQVVEIAGNKEFLEIYTPVPEITEVLTTAVAGKDYSAPKTVYSVKVPESALWAVFDASGLANMEGLSDTLKQKARNQLFGGLASQLNAMSGANVLAASSICTANKTFVNPDITENTLYLYTYEGAPPVAVTFLPGEDGAVYASGTLILSDKLSLDSLDEYSTMLGLLGVELEEVKP